MPRHPRPEISKEQFENHEYCPGCLRSTPNGLDDYKNFSSGNITKTCRDCRNSVIKSNHKKSGKKHMAMRTKNEVLSQMLAEINDGILALLNEKLAEFDQISVNAETKYTVKHKEEKKEVEEKKEEKKVGQKKLGRPRKVVVISDSDSDNEDADDESEESGDSEVDAKALVSKIKDLVKTERKNKGK